jgi:hypothetical protein
MDLLDQYSSYNSLYKDQFCMEDFGAIAPSYSVDLSVQSPPENQRMREHTRALKPRYCKAVSHSSTHGQH